LKKEKCASQRDTEYIQQNNSRKFSKFQERIVHSGTGHLTGLAKIEPLHYILLLKQPVQGTEREY
jgi:Txe/YoeB family toxin of Txe-Axe toxin-antitoxin module